MAPAEQYLRAFWAARYQFPLVVALFVGGALIINPLLPKVYTSVAAVTIKQSAQLQLAGLLYENVIAPASGGGDDRGEQLARRFAKRFYGHRTVTLAAQDVGILDANARLDDRLINSWVEVDVTLDILSILVHQPTPELAQRFAQKLIERVQQENVEENLSAAPQKLLEAQVARAKADVTAAEARAIQASRASTVGAEKKIAESGAAIELDLARKAYVSLQRRLDLIDVILAEQQGHIFVIDPPTFQPRATFPDPLGNVNIGLILGILTATLLVVIRTLFSGLTLRLK